MNDLAVFSGALTTSAAGHLHNRPASYCLVHRLMHVLRCADGERDVDILFFGAMNPQREAIIADVNTSGLAVRVLSGGTMLFGEDLDKMLLKTKIVLNLHFYHGIMVQPSATLPVSCNDP